MNTSTGKRSGARLPLMLLLGFLVVVAGVVVWLVVTDPTPTPDTAKTVAEKAADAPVEKAAHDKSGDTEGKPSPGPDKIDAAGPAPSPAGEPQTPAPGAATPDAKPPTVTPKAAAGDAAADQNSRHSTSPVRRTPDSPPGPAVAQPIAVPPASATAKSNSPGAKTPAKPAARTVMPKKLPRVPPDTPLSPSPDPALIQTTALGPLPRIGTDGRLPRRVYAKPFDATDDRPRIAIVVTGLGLSAAATESAIQGLPGSVTLAFAPYSNRLNEWIRLARAAGHEVLINVPMEPTNYPAYDPGPQTLLTSLNAEGNLDRLLWSLSRGTGYVGVVDFLGSRFTTSRIHMRPVLRAINERGLLYLDSGSTPRSISAVVAREVKVAWATATLTIDQRASRTEIDRKFGELEQHAKRDKRAIGIGSPYPVTLERIANWVRQLEARGIAIAPVSALAKTAPAGRKP